MKNKKFECALGFHEYTILDKDSSYVKICKHCRKYGYYRSSNGYEMWTEYDDRGNEIYWKNSDGYEIWKEYDNKGNLIHYKDSDGFEVWYDYDNEGNVIHIKNSNGDVYLKDNNSKWTN